MTKWAVTLDFVFHSLLFLHMGTQALLIAWKSFFFFLIYMINVKMNWLMRTVSYTTGKQMDMTISEHPQSSHLQCGQRYPVPCPHCPMCWAAIQNGSGTSQTQQVSAIPCWCVLLEQTITTLCDNLLWL